SQLVEAVLVDPEVVRELVQDGDPDLALEGSGVVAEVLEKRPPVDRDPGRKVLGLVEQAVEVGLLRVAVLDHDRHVLEPLRERGRERVEGGADVLFETAHQKVGRKGARTASSFTVSAPNTNPPTWAKNATPPPASGWTTEYPPCQ